MHELQPAGVQEVAFPACDAGRVGRLSLQLNCNSDCVHLLRSMVAVMSSRAGFDECRSNRVAVAVDELFANIAKHAYGGHPGRIEIETEIAGTHGSRALLFEFRDYASCGWTGNIHEAADAPQDLEYLTPGGLGLRLIASIADGCEHEVLEDGNFWRLTFNICNGEHDGR